MTFREIIAAIKGNQARVNSEFQIQASLMHKLGNLIGFAVNQPKDYPSLHDSFPGLFSAPVQKQQHWEIMKSRLEEYQAERRKRGEKKDDS